MKAGLIGKNQESLVYLFKETWECEDKKPSTEG